MDLLTSARTGDANLKGSPAANALGIVRFWVAGFAKNKKTGSLGYLPDVPTLKFLFPSARLTAVRGYETATQQTPWPESQETVLPPWIPQEPDEDVLLGAEDRSLEGEEGDREVPMEEENILYLPNTTVFRPISTWLSDGGSTASHSVDSHILSQGESISTVVSVATDGGTTDQSSVPHTDMEDSLSTVSTRTTTSTREKVSRLTTQMEAFPSLLKQMQADFAATIAKLESSMMPPPPSPAVPRTAELNQQIVLVDPTDSPTNPWMVATERATIHQGRLRDVRGADFPLDNIEFARPMTTLAGSRYRYRESKAEAIVVPSETLLITNEQAKKALMYWAGEMQARPSERPIMGMRVPGFEVDFKEVHPSYLAKTFNCLQESWREIATGEKRFTMKEASSFGFVLPSESSGIPSMKGLRDVFAGDKFGPDSARNQVKAELNKLEAEDCAFEFRSRALMCHMVSSLTMLESLTNDQSPADALNVRMLIRMQLPLLMTLVETWASAKMALRRQALKGGNWKYVHVQDLLYSSPLCESLFPAEILDGLRETAKARMTTLEEYLGFPAKTSFKGSKKRRSSKQRRAAKQRKLAEGKSLAIQGPSSQTPSTSRMSGQGGSFRRPKHPKRPSKGQGSGGPSHIPSKGKGPFPPKGGNAPQQ